MIIDFYRLIKLVDWQLSTNIEYYRLIDYVFDDRLWSTCNVLRYIKFEKHKLDQIAERKIRISPDKLVYSFLEVKLQRLWRKRHEGKYDVSGDESQTSFTRNATRAGSEEGRLFFAGYTFLDQVEREFDIEIWPQSRNIARYARVSHALFVSKPNLIYTSWQH